MNLRQVQKAVGQMLVCLGTCLLPGGLAWAQGGEIGRPGGLSSEFQERENLFSIGGRKVRLGSDEFARHALVVAGTIHLEGEIERNLLVLGGTAVVDGRVGGDVFVIGGSAIFGPRAEIGGETFLVGGPFEFDSQARFHGDQTEVVLDWLLPGFRKLGTLVANTVLLARPFAPNLTETWWLVGGLYLVNLMILLLLPRPMQVSVDALRREPLTSAVVGVLVMILVGPLLVLLVASGFGILLIPFLVCLGSVALLLGKVAVYEALGRRVVAHCGLRQEIPALGFTIGSLCFLMAYMIPIVGFLAIGLVVPWGIGAVLWAAFRAFRRRMGARMNESNGFVGEGARGALKLGSGGNPVAAAHWVKEGVDPVEIADDVDRVGFWPRIAATGLDLILFGFFFSILVSDTGPGSTRLMGFAWLIYHLVFWAFKGTTLGGVIIGIQCVTCDRRPLTWGTAGIRLLGSVFSALAFLIGFFWASWSRERQSWHDIIAGTIMIRMPKGVRDKKLRSVARGPEPKVPDAGDLKTVS